jgi:hypothetical protein
MIRNFLSTLLILGLLCSTGYFYWKTVELQGENQRLRYQFRESRRHLLETEGTHGHKSFVVSGNTYDNLNPLQKAQLHLLAAEHAIAAGNVGTAIQQYNLAQEDVHMVSTSTSDSIRSSTQLVRQRLEFVHEQTDALWKKLGG